MPFKSKAQQGYLYAQHPEVAKKFAAETSNWDLPEHKHNEAAQKAHDYAEARNKSRPTRNSKGE